MNFAHEFYGQGAPIMLVQHKVEFSCEICQKSGWGPANMRVHPGKCRAALIKINAKRAAGRRKRRKLAAREHSMVPSQLVLESGANACPAA